MLQYLKLVRQLDGYGEVAFPHCPCDSRKEGHVIAIVGEKCFKLQACKEDGTTEVCINNIHTIQENKVVKAKYSHFPGEGSVCIFLRDHMT